MSERTALAWLRDARRYALEAHNIASGLSGGALSGSQRDHLAIQFCLALVGEALNEIPKDVQALAPDIPLRAIYNLRNRLIHGFWLTDTDVVRNIAQNSTVPLVASIDRLIEALDG